MRTKTNYVKAVMKCYEIKSNNILHVGGNALLVAQIYISKKMSNYYITIIVADGNCHGLNVKIYTNQQRRGLQSRRIKTFIQYFFLVNQILEIYEKKGSLTISSTRPKSI